MNRSCPCFSSSCKCTRFSRRRCSTDCARSKRPPGSSRNWENSSGCSNNFSLRSNTSSRRRLDKNRARSRDQNHSRNHHSKRKMFNSINSSEAWSRQTLGKRTLREYYFKSNSAAAKTACSERKSRLFLLFPEDCTFLSHPSLSAKFHRW